MDIILHNVDINIQTNNGHSALILASMNGKTETVKLLEEYINNQSNTIQKNSIIIEPHDNGKTIRVPHGLSIIIEFY